MLGRIFCAALIAALMLPAGTCGAERMISVLRPETAESSLLRISYELSDGISSETTVDFDSENRPERAVWSLSDGSRSCLDVLTYDEAGRLMKKQRDFSGGLSVVEEYVYSKDGLLTYEQYTWSDGVIGHTSHEYDRQGRLSRSTCSDRDRWFSGEIVFGYKDGQRSAAEIYNDTVKVGSVYYEYDHGGRVVREEWYLDEDWHQTVEYEYHPAAQETPSVYASSNAFIVSDGEYCLSGEIYDYSGEQGGPSYYEYDDHGKLIDKKFVRSDGLTTQTAFLYDSRGWLTRSYRAYADGRRGVFAYEFNDQGLMAERTLRINDGKASKEAYSYDEQGRLISARWDNFDTWLTGDLSFTHDERGLISTAVFKGGNGFDANIVFTHDDLGRLTKIYWELSYGGTQTYQFQYEKCIELAGG